MLFSVPNLEDNTVPLLNFITIRVIFLNVVVVKTLAIQFDTYDMQQPDM